MLVFQKKTGVGTGTPWDITNAEFVQSYNVGAEGLVTTRCMTFSPDGTKVFGMQFNAWITGFDLTTPWDLSTLTTDAGNTRNLSPTSGRDITFKPDGTKMYLADNGSTLEQYALPTPWDVGSIVSTVPEQTLTFADNNVNGVAWKPDGSQFLYIGNTSDSVHNGFSLGTNWDIDNESTVSGTFSVNPPEGTPMGLTISPDGTKMFISGSGTSSVRQYTLSTPWDATTATFDTSISVVDKTDDPWDMEWRADGKRFWVNDINSGFVHMYKT